MEQKRFISKLLSNDGFIMVNKALIKLVGLHNAVLIGELCSEYNYYSTKNLLVDNEWFFATIANIENNTGLTRKLQDSCIKQLVEKQIIEIKTMGMPAKRYINIQFDNLEKLLNDEKSPEIKDCPNGTNKDVPTGQTRMSPEDKQELSEKVDNTTKKAQKKQLIRINNKNNNKNKSSSSSIKSDDGEKDFVLKDIALKFGNLEFEDIQKNAVLEEITDLINKIVVSHKKYYVISSEKVIANDLINKILALDKKHIEYIVRSVILQNKKIKNRKSYIISMLYNAIDNYNIYNFDDNTKNERDIYNQWFINNILKKNAKTA